jgi:hypothetical protein
MAGINKKNTLWVLLLAVCCGCGSKELTIEPIGNKISYPYGGYSYYRDSVKLTPCVDSLRYYTIANYKRIAPDSLYNILHTYINSKRLYDEFIENIERDSCYCFFSTFFYEKPLFGYHRKFMIFDAIRSESGSIDEYRHKLVALIWTHEHRGVTVSSTVLYDVKANRISAISGKLLSIRWEKEDTVLVQPEYRY